MRFAELLFSLGVNILPICCYPDSEEKMILVEKIYRAPVDCYCIEFPGGSLFYFAYLNGIGLLEENESPEVCALRELKEETGYVGKIVPNVHYSFLPVCCGTGSESTCLVPVTVAAKYFSHISDRFKYS